MCAHVGALAAVEPESTIDRRRLEITRATIEAAMITYPPLVRFPEIEDAGWSALREAITGRCDARAATDAIQAAATDVLGSSDH